MEAFAEWTLDRCLEAASKGNWSADLLASLHKWLSRDPTLLRTYLQQHTLNSGWESTNRLLQSLRQTQLASWIPAEYSPSLAFLDLECSVDRKVIRELAVLIAQEGCPPVEFERVNHRGLSNPDLHHVLQESGRHAPTIWLGHNVIAFDQPRLRERSIELPSPAVLDTLQMSLILRPMARTHALRGDHTALGDVRATLRLYQEFDQEWRTLAPEEIAWHRYWLAGNPGFVAYFNWLLLRHPRLEVSRPSTPPRATPSGRGSSSLPSPSPPGCDLIPHLDSFPGRGTLCLHRPTRGEDLSALAAWARQRNLVLVAPTAAVQRFRDLHASSEVLPEATWMLGDRSVDELTLRNLLPGRLTGLQASFLLRWLGAGGKLWQEIHPIAREWLDPELSAQVFTRVVQDHAAIIMDHAAWLSLTPRPAALIVDAERLEWAVNDSLSPAFTVEPLSEATLNAARTFFSNRLLLWDSETPELSELPVTADDIGSTDYTTLVNAILAEARHELAATSEPTEAVMAMLKTHGTGLHFSLRKRGDDSWSFHVRRLREDPAAWLRENIGSGNVVCTGPIGQGLLLERVKTYLPSDIAFVTPTPRTPLKVLQGTVSSRIAPGSSLHTAAAHILTKLQSAEDLLPSFLGGSSQGRQALLNVLRGHSVPVYDELHYGSRNRTVERLSGITRGCFLANARPFPLPLFAKTVLVERLPFPRRDHPAIVAAIRELEAPDQAFEKVVLPRMVERLYNLIKDLDTQEVTPILLDHRALTSPRIRREVEEVVGRIVQAPSPPRGLLTPSEIKSLRDCCLPEKPRPRYRLTNSTLDLTPVLRKLHGPEATWRPGQETIVRTILSGQDVLVVMPTGSGKSSCFQIPALVRATLEDALTVVLSPLLALMRDQVRHLTERGVYGVARYDSSLDEESKSQVINNIRNGWLALLYMAPEQLLNERMVTALCDRGVALLVIDEAHCVSEWGHDFRPDYRRIPRFLDTLEQSTGSRPQVAAFTATAPQPVRGDICKALGIKSRPLNMGVRRDDLFPAIRVVDDDSDIKTRLDEAEPFLREHSGQPGLVYCLSKRSVEEVAEELRARHLPGFPPSSIDFYHAGVADREARERAFIEKDGPTIVMVCTTAFGMGVDKPDIHWVLHLFGAGSVEAYAQEIGRSARRPGLDGHTLSLASTHDLDSWEQMNRGLDDAQVHHVLSLLKTQAQQPSRDVIARPQTLAWSCGLKKEEHGLAAIFALERAGALEVVARGNCRFTLSLLSRPPHLEAGSFEEVLLRDLPSLPQEATVDLAELASKSGMDIPLEELVRRVRMLLDAGHLHTPKGFQIVPRLKSPAERRQVLARSIECLTSIFEWIRTSVKSAGGRKLKISTAELTRVRERLGISQEEWVRVFDDLRAHAIVYSTPFTEELSITVARRENPERALRQLVKNRQAFFDRLERGWKSGKDRFNLPRSEAGKAQLQALAGLSAWMILACSYDAVGGACFRVQLTDAAFGPAPRLDLGCQRASRKLRFEALRNLFGCARDSKSIWDFLHDYFEGVPKAPIRPEVASELLKDLTPDQKKAVQFSPQQPLLINAVAGSGKTHVLARRALSLQANWGIRGGRLLVLSHSRAGASAIGERIRELASKYGLDRVRCQTFHAFCYSLYRELGGTAKVVERVALPKALWAPLARRGRRYNSVLVSRYEALLEGASPVSSRRDSPGCKIEDYAGLFDSIRHGHPELPKVITVPEDLDDPTFPEMLGVPNEDGKLDRREVQRVFSLYIQAMEQDELIDFAGMIAECLNALRVDDLLKDDLRDRFDHILVDEFQDTSRAQEELFRCLLGDQPNITVVGDNDQTIYTFNGSDVTNILEFAARNGIRWKSAPTQHIPLEENFRCTPRILNLAGTFIRRNQRRLPKSIRPSQHVTPKREVYRGRNAPVLVVPKEDPELALQHCVETIKTWIKEGISPEEIAVLSRINPPHDPDRSLLTKLGVRLKSAGILSRRTGDELPDDKLRDVLQRIAADGEMRLEQVLEIDLATLGDSLKVDPEELLEVLTTALNRGLETVSELVEELAIPSPSQNNGNARVPGVRLKTIHAAKGEEYRRVIVLYVAGNFFPPTTRYDPEEERRLLYVAMTRAEEVLHVVGRGNSFLFTELETDAHLEVDDDDDGEYTPIGKTNLFK